MAKVIRKTDSKVTITPISIPEPSKKALDIADPGHSFPFSIDPGVCLALHVPLSDAEAETGTTLHNWFIETGDDAPLDAWLASVSAGKARIIVRNTSADAKKPVLHWS